MSKKSGKYQERRVKPPSKTSGTLRSGHKGGAFARILRANMKRLKRGS